MQQVRQLQCLQGNPHQPLVRCNPSRARRVHMERSTRERETAGRHGAVHNGSVGDTLWTLRRRYMRQIRVGLSSWKESISTGKQL